MPDIFVTNNKSTSPQNTHEESSPVDTKKRHISPPPKPKEKHEVAMFETFCEYPGGITFQHQEKDEEIILFLRQHLVTNVPWIVIAALMVIAPLILIPFFSYTPFLLFTVPERFLIALLLFYYLGIVSYVFINFIHWFYNIGIVTNKRVVDLDYSHIVHVNVAATKVLQIQDVNYIQTGFLRTLFNFGDIHIQTAGQNPNFEFLRVPNPSKATFIIQKLIGIA